MTQTKNINVGPNPAGLCMCGCGEPAAISTRNRPELGYIKGKPGRFAFGHSSLYRFHVPADPNPTGLCMCGCGQPTSIATRNRPGGQVKGKPKRFVTGHGRHEFKSGGGPNPSGMCMCGCGTPAPIAKISRSRRGVTKGQPAQYIAGHQQQHRRQLARINNLDDWYSVDSATGCWIWLGKLTRDGYGVVHIGGSATVAHRVIYERTYGPVPPGKELDHACPHGPKKACVNPDHLDPVTHAENMQRAVDRARNGIAE